MRRLSCENLMDLSEGSSFNGGRQELVEENRDLKGLGCCVEN